MEGNRRQLFITLPIITIDGPIGLKLDLVIATVGMKMGIFFYVLSGSCRVLARGGDPDPS